MYFSKNDFSILLAAPSIIIIIIIDVLADVPRMNTRFWVHVLYADCRTIEHLSNFDASECVRIIRTRTTEFGENRNKNMILNYTLEKRHGRQCE